MKWVAAVFLGLWALPALAQDDAGALARAAGGQLEAASVRLSEADSARDRVRALTETVHAYEAGLSAMRSGLRRASIREAQLRGQLQARDAEIAQLVAVLQTLSPGQSPTAFLHPDGPNGTARAGMLLAELTPALNQRAAQLRQDLDDVESLRVLQEQAAVQLQTGLTEVQTARSELNQAMAERTDLPQRFVEDPVRTAILIASAETLDAFSSGLANIAEDDAGWTPPEIDDLIGEFPMPARGVILRRAGEPDAAGITRPGILLATRPGTLVTSPTAATLRYVGPLLDFGTVTILEPRPGTLIVLAGLDVSYGSSGQIISAGTPLGLMGGLPAQDAATPASTGGEGGGADRSETLYIEVRENNVPMDPLTWFSTEQDG
ncbi:murein hydrolase activator EnvC [uncultured Tateyamaria sp.]|uniref:murein hydrolase activator EnvC family protein n=1 Tax=uncultured Tateyamaria sp. TaxID=455651 RepID=UPI0026065A1C|nr:peptidoglycan DD-metalloendopeptidase family protein [uncultured Tateyamaria sp.]